MSHFYAALNTSTKETLAEDDYVAKITAFNISRKIPIDRDPFADWEFTIIQGEHTGLKLTDGRRVTDASFPFLLNAVVVIAGRRPTSSEELFDEAANTAGPIKSLIIGATVKIRIVRRPSNGRVFTNIEIVELISPPDAFPTVS